MFVPLTFIIILIIKIITPKIIDNGNYSNLNNLPIIKYNTNCIWNIKLQNLEYNSTQIYKKLYNNNFISDNLMKSFDYIDIIHDILANPAFKPILDYLNNNTTNYNYTIIFLLNHLELFFNFTEDGIMKFFYDIIEDKQILTTIIDILNITKMHKDILPFIISYLKNNTTKSIRGVALNTLYIIRDEPDLIIEILFELLNGTNEEIKERNEQIYEMVDNFKNISKIIEIVPKFVKKNKKIFESLLELLIIFIKYDIKGNNYLGNLFRLLSIKIDFTQLPFNITLSTGCSNLLNFAFCGYYKGQPLNNSDNSMDYFLYKFVWHSPKSKNHFFSYDNCLDKSYTLLDIQQKINQNLLDISMAYIITSVEDKKDFSELKKTTELEKSYYYIALCLPQGFKTPKNYDNNTNSFYYCEENDYSEITKLLLSFTSNIDKHEYKSIILMDRDHRTKTKKFLELIPLFILAIPLILSLILLLFRNKYLKKKTKYSKIDMPLNSSTTNNHKRIHDGETSEDSIELSDEHIKINDSNKILNAVPKWYRVINEFFNFKDNFNELLNFDSDKKIINNMSGLNYILGIMGISIMLLILGHTFLSFMNYPLKDFGYNSFLELIFSPFYILPFIGLRYSPRVIFSCSGYICIYKYLSFLEKGEKYYFLKFFFPQAYKYIYFILIICFGRFSLYHLQKDLTDVGPSWEIFNEQLLKHPKSTTKFILDLFIIKSFKLQTDFKRKIGTLFNYFWMPVNEFVFFFFGVSLISIGYNFKLRIDYIIIALIILLYLFKIIFYFCYNHYTETIYTTLYYYLFDYGRLMINPLFNLDYYLIGMYFGLMNYTIQKGINNSKNDNILKKFKNDNNGILEEEDLILNKQEKAINTTQYLDPLKIYDIVTDEEEEEEKEDNENNKESELFRKTKRTSSSLGAILDNTQHHSDLFDTFNMKNKKKKKNKNKNINDNDISEDNIEFTENIKEIKDMPFLISAIQFVNLNKNKKYTIILAILFIMLALIILFFMTAHMIFFMKKARRENNTFIELREQYLMKYLITNRILNIIYLIDIEIVVFWTQWVFFYFFMKELNTIVDFCSNIYWSIFVKSYFSLLMAISPIILYILFESDTIIRLDILNIYLYYFIGLIIIIGLVIINYIGFELPLKKIFRYLFKRNAKLNSFDENDYENEVDDDDEY